GAVPPSPTRRSSDLVRQEELAQRECGGRYRVVRATNGLSRASPVPPSRSDAPRSTVSGRRGAGFRPASPPAGGDHLVHGGRAYPVLCEPGADGARDLDRVRAVTVQADRVGVDLDGRSVDRGDTAVEH